MAVTDLPIIKPMTGMDAAMSMVGNDIQQVPIDLPVNNPTAESYMDVNQISTATPEGYVPSEYEKEAMKALDAQYAPKEIGALGKEALYPGLGHNINVGGYSGSIIGSGNIYVPGGDIMAIDPILARRKAIDDAAKLRAAELIKPFEYQKPKAFKDARFQQKMDKAVFDFNDEYVKQGKEMYGQNWRAMLKDQSTELGSKYVRGLHNFETIISNMDAVTDMVVELDKGLKDKSIYLTPEQKKAYDDYKKMTGDFTDYDTFTKSDFEQLHSVLTGARDFNDYLNKSGILTKLEGEISSSFSVNDKGEYYKLSTNEKTSYKDIINDLTKSLVETTFSNEIANGIYTEAQIKEAIGARLKDQVKNTGSMQQKNEAAVGRANEEKVPELTSGAVVEYGKDQEGVTKTPRYDKNGNILPGYENVYRTRADFNMKITGPKNDILVRNTKGELVKQNFNGLKLNDVVILDDYGNPKTLAGGHYVQLGEQSVLANGDVVQKVTMARPTTTTQKVGDDEFSQQTFLIQDEYILLEKGGKGTSMFSDIKTQMKNKDAINNYEKGYKKMQTIANGVRNPSGTQPSTQSTVQSIKRSDIPSKASAAGYTVDEYTKLLNEKGITIKD